jgi:ATP-binding cassette subfamily F protein 3
MKFMSKDHEIRSYLARFGLVKDMPMRPINTLSGGEKCRLAFADLTFQNPDVLILDEPTNHLDIESINVLISALKEYNGAVIFVSHNQYFIRSLDPELHVLSNGKLKRYDGTFDDYKNEIVEKILQ